jgi:hypothetical protein
MARQPIFTTEVTITGGSLTIGQWVEMESVLTRISTGKVHRVVKSAGHYVGTQMEDVTGGEMEYHMFKDGYVGETPQTNGRHGFPSHAFKNTSADPAALHLTGAEMALKVLVEIRKDMGAGTIPLAVTSFAELHDYVDANEYLLAAMEDAGEEYDPADEKQTARNNQATDYVSEVLTAALQER